MQKDRLLSFAISGLLLVAFFSFGVFAQSDASSKLTGALLEKVQQNPNEFYTVNIAPKKGLSLNEFNALKGSLDADRVTDFFYPYVIQVETSGSDILSLAQSDNFIHFEEDIPLELALQDSVNIVGAVDAWDKIIDGVHLDGSGQTICVGDTGVDFSHPDLVGKNALGGSCQLDCADNYNQTTGACTLECGGSDGLGHGTEVAGVAGADGEVQGIAKGAGLISLRISSVGSNQVDDIAVWRALDWCTNHAQQYNISAISLSLQSGNLYSNYCDGASPFFTQFIGSAVDNGVGVPIASGNYGSNDSISFPACISSAIPVAATEKNQHDSVWFGSNYNQMVKIFAPGAFINTTQMGGGYSTASGTSLSTPMVAASIAMVNQYLDLTGHGARSMNPLDIEQLLFEEGEQISLWDFVNDPVPLPTSQWTRINVNNALLALDEIAPEVQLVSPSDGQVVVDDNLPVSVDFSCDATDWQLSDLTFELRDNHGGLVYRETQNVSGESAEGNFVFPLTRGTYRWNCFANDMKGNLAGSSESYSLRIASPVPVGSVSFTNSQGSGIGSLFGNRGQP